MAFIIITGNQPKGLYRNARELLFGGIILYTVHFSYLVTFYFTCEVERYERIYITNSRYNTNFEGNWYKSKMSSCFFGFVVKKKEKWKLLYFPEFFDCVISTMCRWVRKFFALCTAGRMYLKRNDDVIERINIRLRVQHFCKFYFYFAILFGKSRPDKPRQSTDIGCIIGNDRMIFDRDMNEFYEFFAGFLLCDTRISQINWRKSDRGCVSEFLPLWWFNQAAFILSFFCFLLVCIVV